MRLLASVLALSVAWTAAIATTATATASTASYRVNGWYPCAFSSSTDKSTYGDEYDEMTIFDCADLEVPLCYDGVCESDKTINVFVKRLLANPDETSSTATKALILIQGGPGASSDSMESTIISLLDDMNGTVDFYTFDHRGTGRSEYLNCEAAQALTDGSPNGASITVEELTNCLRDLNFQFDGHAEAFSTTSAAMDVRAIVETFLADQEVYIAGYSYGTYLLQRILQLEIPQVVGYIFDSVDALSGPKDPIESANSHWNEAILTSSRRLLQACFDDAECPLVLESRDTVLEEVLALYDTLDANATTHLGAQLLLEYDPTSTPSNAVRDLLSGMVSDIGARVKAIHILALLQQGTPEATEQLRGLLKMKQSASSSLSATERKAKLYRALNILTDDSELLYYVIVASERWSIPSPTETEMDAMKTAGPFSMVDDSFTYYCIFTGAQDTACDDLATRLDLDRNVSFSYARDTYFSTPLVIPEHASVLILAGGLDFATPLEFSELLYSKLEGGRGKLLATFAYGTHCGGEATETQSATPCYDGLIGSFIQHDGDVEAMDTTCMKQLPPMSFVLPEEDEQ